MTITRTLKPTLFEQLFGELLEKPAPDPADPLGSVGWGQGERGRLIQVSGAKEQRAFSEGHGTASVASVRAMYSQGPEGFERFLRDFTSWVEHYRRRQ